MAVFADLVDDKNGSDELPDVTDLTDDQSRMTLLLKSMLRSPPVTQDDIADSSVLRKFSFWDHLTGWYQYEMKNKSMILLHWIISKIEVPDSNEF